jgi:hypothetical protein
MLTSKKSFHPSVSRLNVNDYPYYPPDDRHLEFPVKISLPPLRLMVLLSLFLFVAGIRSVGQDTISPVPVKDTTLVKVHSPRKATLCSVFLPGLGQAYNEKYWKIPVIYIGFGTLAYFIKTNDKKYKDFRDAYAWSTADTTGLGPPPNDLVYRYDSDNLLVGRQYYRRNLEISYIVTGLWYILNIVDATVDAHFFDYNINEDLSIKVKPWISPPMAGLKQSGGLTISMRF